MARSTPRRYETIADQVLGTETIADQVLGTPQETMVDIIDQLLNKGVTAHGVVTLGVAGVDLIYLRLAALLCAADRVVPLRPGEARSKPAARRPRGRGGPRGGKK